MITCEQGCGQPLWARGLCQRHYAKQRYHLSLKGQWDGLVDSTGTARRLQALVALGYTQTYLGQRIGWHSSNTSLVINMDRPTVLANTARRVAALYDELAMTPGPSSSARKQAERRGWAPPLAWDEDEIDNPEAHPDKGAHVKPNFMERYRELRDLGYSDFDILRKWEIRPESLLRQLHRYGLPPNPELVTIVSEIKHRQVAS